MVELGRLGIDLDGRILAKLDYLNPGFSKKDRIARQIIEDIRGEVVEDAAEEESNEEDKGETDRQGWGLVSIAHADETETSVSNPAIEAIKARIKGRAASLIPFFDAGAVGEGSDGIVEIRDIKVVSMKERAVLNRLVKEENGDREDLYKKVAEEQAAQQALLALRVGKPQGLVLRAPAVDDDGLGVAVALEPGLAVHPPHAALLQQGPSLAEHLLALPGARIPGTHDCEDVFHRRAR